MRRGFCLITLLISFSFYLYVLQYILYICQYIFNLKYNIMANTIKPKRQKKVAVGFAVKRWIMEDFKDFCLTNNLVPSNVVEELMLKFLKDKEKGRRME